MKKVIPREVVKRKHISWSREIRNLQASLKLTPIQEEFLIGTILGDASIVANVGGKNYRLQIEQCDKQKAYVWWKYDIFKDWVLSEPKFQEKNQSWRFRTITHPVFKEFRNLFYQGSKKIIPDNIDEILVNPLSLATWFMDDGLKKGKNGFSVCTHAFSDEGIEILRQCLAKNFSLQTNVHWDGKGKLLYFPVSQKDRLKALLYDLILPEFRYKFSFY